MQKDEDEISRLLGKRQAKILYYDWSDALFASFMMAVMQNLEPRQYQKDDIMMHEFEEVDEVLYVCTGEVTIPALYLLFIVCSGVPDEQPAIPGYKAIC